MTVAIAGYGMEGRSNLAYFSKLYGRPIIFDEREALDDVPEGVETVLGPASFHLINEYDVDLVVRSAGVAPYKLHTTKPVWSATNEFFDKCKTPIIGVTGSKGKGTTCSLIHSILKEAGLKTLLVGNIGLPALDALDEANKSDVIVYELSSFQLWDAVKSPQTAVVLAIEPDHLDVHKDMDDYVNAKANIRRYQLRDIDHPCYYHPTNEYSRRIALALKELASDEYHCEGCQDACKPRPVSYRYASEESVFVRENHFVDNMGRTIAPISALKLPGRHNIENACAAIAAAQHYTLDLPAFERGLAAFTGLPHRLKLVGEVKGVRFYDDSIATTPGSAVAALKAFDEPKVIILGGSDKGADYTELVALCRDREARVVAIGKTGAAIAQLCRDKGVEVKELGVRPMSEIVTTAFGLSLPGGVVIMSPASASFDMFTSYADRGDRFIAAVKELEAETRRE